MVWKEVGAESSYRGDWKRSVTGRTVKLIENQAGKGQMIPYDAKEDCNIKKKKANLWEKCEKQEKRERVDLPWK